MSPTLRPAAPRCPCTRAGLPEGARQCGLCDFDEANGVPTVRPPASERCGCGRLEVPGYDCCEACARSTPDHLVAAFVALDVRIEQLPVAERLAIWRRVQAARVERTAARLARGPG